MQEAKSFEAQIRDLYSFFVSAERNNEEVTYEQMKERLVDRSYDTLVWYANNFWTWFLTKKKERRGRYKVFVCHDLARYPEAFFVDAHLNRQGKYFYHFGKALDDSRERARIRKQPKEQLGLPQAELSEPPAEVEQEFPEELHFADNETEEVEGSESAAAAVPTTYTSATTTTPLPGEVPPFAAVTSVIGEPSPGIPLRERIADMLGFSRKDREALEQLRTLVQTLTQEQSQLRSHITSELQTVSSQLRTEFADQIQAVGQALAKEQEHPDFSPIHADLAAKLSHVEQTVTEVIKQLPAPPALASIRAELERSTEHLRQTLTEEVQQLRPPSPDFSPISADLAQVEQRLTIALSQLPALPDLAPIRAELDSLQRLLLEEIRQPRVAPEVLQIATGVADVQRQVERLAPLAEQFALLISLSSDGHAGPIQASIKEASMQVQTAIATLEGAYGKWLGELEQQLRTMRKKHNEVRRDYDDADRYLETIMVHVSPDGGESQESVDAHG